MEFDERTGTWHAYGKAPFGRLPARQGKNSSNKLASIKPVSISGGSRFACYLAMYFPEVLARVEEADLGVLHLEVAALKSASHDAIVRRDWATLMRHYEFVDNVLEIADTELHDGLGISYLVNLFYNETSVDFAKARTMLPKRLAVALEIMERHYEELPR